MSLKMGWRILISVSSMILLLNSTAYTTTFHIQQITDNNTQRRPAEPV